MPESKKGRKGRPFHYVDSDGIGHFVSSNGCDYYVDKDGNEMVRIPADAVWRTGPRRKNSSK